MQVTVKGQFVATSTSLIPVSNTTHGLEYLLHSALGLAPGQVVTLNISAEHTPVPNWIQCKEQTGSGKYHYGCGGWYPKSGTCPNSADHYVPEPDTVQE